MSERCIPSTSAQMAGYNSLMNVLGFIDDKKSQRNDTAQRSQPSSNTSVQVDLRFKMVKEYNNTCSPSPTLDECSSSTSLDDVEQKESDPREDMIQSKLSMRGVKSKT